MRCCSLRLEPDGRPQLLNGGAVITLAAQQHREIVVQVGVFGTLPQSFAQQLDPPLDFNLIGGRESCRRPLLFGLGVRRSPRRHGSEQQQAGRHDGV